MDESGSGETFVIIISAALAMLSFIAFALPLLNRNQKKEHFQSVIERRRKDLFAQTTAEIALKGTKTMSASQSVAASYKVQKMMGQMGEKVRDQMLMAGIRSPTAPIKYMVARILLPFVGLGIAMMFISAMEEPPSKVTTLIYMLMAVLAGYFLPRLLLKNMITKRSQEINLSFSDALDLMLICVQGGIGLEQTVQRIAVEISDHSPVLAEELGILSAEMAMLNDRRAALHDFGRRVGSGAARNFARTTSPGIAWTSSGLRFHLYSLPQSDDARKLFACAPQTSASKRSVRERAGRFSYSWPATCCPSTRRNVRAAPAEPANRSARTRGPATLRRSN